MRSTVPTQGCSHPGTELIVSGRKDRVAQAVRHTGLLRLLESMPRRPQLLVVNYHRIGNRDTTLFDPEIYSIDQQGLSDQIAFLKKNYDLLQPRDAVDIILGRVKPSALSVMLTFDDGYLDNLTLAVPVLQAHKATAAFFLVTGYLDDPDQTTWWDETGWLVRKCIGRKLTISQPEPWSVDVTAANVDDVIRDVLLRLRRPGTDEKLLIKEMRLCVGMNGEALNTGTRLLMNWAEARQLQDAGMTIGLHTHTQSILAKLDEGQQRQELTTCQRLMRDRLGIEASLFAYPVGTRAAFTAATKRLVEDVGFEAAFSFYGGTNTFGEIDRFDVRRVAFPAYAPLARTRLATALMAGTRRVWF